jgi:hypothetical protein
LTVCFDYTCLLCPQLFVMSFVSPKRLSSNRLTRTLHGSLCREIFCRSGSHVVFDLLRLYCRYLCLNMSLIGMRAFASLVYSHLFFMSCLVDLSCISPGRTKTRQKRPPPPSCPEHLVPLANEDSTVKRVLAPSLLAFSLRDFT